jgi:hypothetical protein
VLVRAGWVTHVTQCVLDASRRGLRRSQRSRRFRCWRLRRKPSALCGHLDTSDAYKRVASGAIAQCACSEAPVLLIVGCWRHRGCVMTMPAMPEAQTVTTLAAEVQRLSALVNELRLRCVLHDVPLPDHAGTATRPSPEPVLMLHMPWTAVGARSLGHLTSCYKTVERDSLVLFAVGCEGNICTNCGHDGTLHPTSLRMCGCSRSGQCSALCSSSNAGSTPFGLLSAVTLSKAQCAGGSITAGQTPSSELAATHAQLHTLENPSGKDLNVHAAAALAGCSSHDDERCFQSALIAARTDIATV